jgi:hypothetical protein
MGIPGILEEPVDGRDNPVRGTSVPERVLMASHAGVTVRIIKEFRRLSNDRFGLATDQLGCTDLDDLRSLRYVPENQKRNSDGRSLFLDPT